VQSKILIVADDRDIRELLVHSLSHSELRVFSASDGRSALLQFGLVLPDLIVLDMSLPDLDSWETLHRLRELSSVPVIVLTTVEEEARLAGLRHGADFSMAKPLSIRELTARVHALLRRAHHTIPFSQEPQTA
jgi:DNA-binding response OmpR family regulator